ncbi:MAG TPA: electron-transfer flavoprotein:ubiquinone oxidoreductase [Candidatus Polarisedimenticolaceae bacterium]|nr:electron-transfer flavoprotein:ubiquinone oxidoreductase [Candidatus Polarisedimenticolaceae bacterium]
MSPLVPARYQPPLPLERLLLAEPPGAEATPLDVLFVGAGPAGLAGAIHLAQLVRRDAAAGGGLGPIEIGVLEKAASLGAHCLSGAVVDPRPLRELFPELPPAELPLIAPVERERVHWLSARGQRRVPTPAEMRNHGHYTASICELVRWLGARAEELGVNLFLGFPAEALFVRDGRVLGVRTSAAGLDREGRPAGGYTPPNDLTARVTVLADGTRSSLAQAWLASQRIGSANPQLYALGVKELWQVRRPLDAVVHTLGWPLPGDAFGGSWCYPMGPEQLSLGLVVGLDYRQRTLDVHVLLQRMKLHPLFRELLEGGELLEWGAKTIPEGGYHALPERLHGDGLLVVGDAAGLVNVAALKGIHYAMQSGIFAAQAIFDALKANDPSAARLGGYDRRLRESYVGRDLHRTRNMRLAFKSGFYRGGAKAWLMSLTGGAFPGGRIPAEPDAAEPREAAPAEPFQPDGRLTFGKLDAVFRSGNSTRDDVPLHLQVGPDVPPELAEFYAHLCPAGVYERDGDRLVVNAPNCVDCKATDVLGPRWSPREGGSGPNYRRM